jgi:hypothetical protein
VRHSRSGRCGEKKYLVPAGIRTQPVARRMSSSLIGSFSFLQVFVAKATKRLLNFTDNGNI